ncbi:aromatic acid exporter family protein [Streptomyces sp. NPDC050743]|uniref:aromatic acid exporter family protein n=1 Tax=Streptomyces sp. NPDC050743 TaxID=3365634 RepID=UPI0037AF440F
MDHFLLGMRRGIAGATPQTWTTALRGMSTIRASRGGYVLSHGVKSLIAAVLTWRLIALWLPGQQQFLGVGTALVMANASTVYSSVVHAVRRVAIQVSGVSLAVAAAWLLGATAGAIVAVLMVVLVSGGRRNGEDRLQVASTAVISLTAAAAAPVGHVVVPVVSTLGGAMVGIAINALVFPPTYLGQSDTAVRSLARCMGTLLQDMGRGLTEGRSPSRAHIWLERTRELEQQVAEARDEVRKAAESLRWNARAAARRHHMSDVHAYALEVLHTASFQVRGIARTLADNIDQDTGHGLKQEFAVRYGEALELAGQVFTTYAAVGVAADANQGDAQRQLRTVIDRMLTWHAAVTGLIERGALSNLNAWHVYGSLVADVERLLTDLDSIEQPEEAGAAQVQERLKSSTSLAY